jgi:selenocysteine lyase/cysteine desulfurase
VALAAAIRVLRQIGMETIASHEHHLMEHAYAQLSAMPGITLYGPTENLAEKVGVIPFNVTGVHHALTAAILGIEGGIGVRNGCFCAHPYVKELLGVGAEEDRAITAEVLAGNKSRLPGMVRASFGCYNNDADIDAMVEMLERILRHEYHGRYVQNTATGAFHAEGFAPDFRAYVSYDEPTTPPESRVASEAS